MMFAFASTTFASTTFASSTHANRGQTLQRRQAKATIDHKTIKQWVEARDGCPAHIKGTESDGHPGILRIDYTGFSGQQSLEKISWKNFFDAFKQNQLAFLYQEEPKSRFSKLVARNSVDVESEKKNGSSNGSKAAKKRGSKATRKPARSNQRIDAIELLTQQHREVEQLFEKLQAARGNAQKERIFAKLADALAAHTKIEETFFYPTAFNEQTEGELREAVEEHLMAKRLLADLMEMECSEPQFMSKVAVLKEVVMHHVEEEEEELFQQVRKEGMDDLEFLGEKMQRRYRQLMKQKPSSVIPQETQVAAEL